MDENMILIELEIDEDLRTITIPNKGTIFGVVGDVEVNRVKFILPSKYYRGFDLSEFKAKINYVNPNGDSNYYKAGDMIIQDSKLAFIWLMTSDVTAYSGDVRFSVTLYKTNDSFIEKRFNTRSATGRVLDGLNVETYVTPEQQQTLLQKLESDIKEDVKAYINQYVESKVSEITQELPEAINSLKEDLGNIIYKGLINGFDKDNTVGGYLYKDGNVYSDSRFVTSDYFDVHENKTYYALQMIGTVKYDNVSYICFYDSSKTFIAGGYFFASSCTSPNGSKYARVTFPNDEAVKARCMFTSIETPDKYYPFGYEYSVITKDVSELKTDVSELKTRKSENRLYGKTMAVLGDSMAKGHTLSENQTWAYKIASRNNMTYQKVAVNGTFITTGHGDSADANCLLEQLKKITGNPDIIVIHMGTNDRVKNTEIGSWSSTNIDTTNICGALRVAFEYILEHFTSSQVMFITPYFYREQTDYIGAIENACVNIGTVHCKNNKQGGICAWNDTVKSMYFIDSVHLNELGQERAACEYEGFMRTFM